MSNFIDDECGATMLEYALLIALVALVVVLGAMAFGLAVRGLFNNASDATDDAGTLH